ncbi:hypothetical protein FE782_18600 [Paenibacillus antri]|uniref:Uncharacterized protein n=1 Tax=Paenibacillus antri TaxID=2582848 RepID=A0A5R9GDI3_9BACL|nr:hypothetical protein [Paenibacillus antri]TLS50713.1 hypothetical protein FE782_18600 [Paenibacillus antri]
MKRRRYASAVAALLIVAPVVVSLLHYGFTRVDDAYESPFRRSLAEAASGGDVLDMATVAPFDWDRMYMFPPYTTRDQMEDTVGTKWTPPVGYVGYLIHRSEFGRHVLNDDSVHKLVFVHGDDVVLDITLDRTVDFASSRGMVLRDEARYTLERMEDGRVVARNTP